LLPNLAVGSQLHVFFANPQRLLLTHRLLPIPFWLQIRAGCRNAGVLPILPFCRSCQFPEFCRFFEDSCRLLLVGQLPQFGLLNLPNLGFVPSRTFCFCNNGLSLEEPRRSRKSQASDTD
jgi:hypothetical protein